MLQSCIDKINEVAQDLRVPQTAGDLDHQAAKLERVIEQLRAIRDGQGPNETPGASMQVHGHGTGKD